MKHITQASTILICAVVLLGCKAEIASSQDVQNTTPNVFKSNGPSSSESARARRSDLFEIVGTVQYKNIEGGFYAIVGDDGKKFNPINLPKSFRKDGLKVKVTARLKTETVSFRMYGAMIEIVNITTQARHRYLLLDSRMIDKTENARLVLGRIQKHKDNPLFGEDKPWEKRFDNLYANVMYDEEEKTYKCWYSPFIVDDSARGMTLKQRTQAEYDPPNNREMAICYATSKEGISWVKPELGRVAYDRSKATNILWRGIGEQGEHWEGPHGTGIFRDLRDPDPKRRYKAFLKAEILSVAFSADGIEWSPAITCPEADSAGDTHNNAFWAPTLGEYVGITREWGRTFGRQVARTSSVDFVNWTKSEVVLEGLDKGHQTYAMPVFYHGGVYLGLVAIHDQEADRVWTELTWSPDTIKWHRVSAGTPLIPNAQREGDYDWGCVYASACPVFLEKEIRLYYGGSDGYHFGWRNGFFCLATLRPDGFAGYTQIRPGKPATITTTPIVHDKGTLRLCADVDPKGYVKVRVFDDHHTLLAESEPLNGTITDEQVTWQNAFSFDRLETKSATIQFELQDATVYSFCFLR